MLMICCGQGRIKSDESFCMYRARTISQCCCFAADGVAGVLPPPCFPCSPGLRGTDRNRGVESLAVRALHQQDGCIFQAPLPRWRVSYPTPARFRASIDAVRRVAYTDVLSL